MERLDAKPSNMSQVDRPLLVVTVIAAILGVVAIVLAIVAISRPPPPSQGGVNFVQTGGGNYSAGYNGQMAPSTPEKKIWTIGYGHDWGPHEYFDRAGYLKGFSMDFIKAVCQAGNMDCRTIWMPYSDCFKSTAGQHPAGGQGLLDKWVDGCLGWLVTVDRIHIFDFTISYLKAETSFFYVLPGSSFNPSDISGKKIGFVSGWYSDEKCLARSAGPTRSGYMLPRENVFRAIDANELVQMLKDRKIDAAFAGYGEMEKYMSGIARLETSQFNCVLSGSAMMTYKGSPFIAAWNDAFNKLRANGGFAKLCVEGQEDHQQHGNVECID